MKRLKAYYVTDGNDGSCIRFATNSATARREGANELDLEWGDIDSCTRRPEFDQFAPGPVPPDVLIEEGWWFECQHCGVQVDEYIETEIKAEGQIVYCSPSCQSAEYAEHRARQAAEVALIELFESKYPDCTIRRVHVYGKKLEPSERHGGTKCCVDFMFPGAKYGATFVYGDDHLFVANGDLPAYYAWQGIDPRTNDERAAA